MRRVLSSAVGQLTLRFSVAFFAGACAHKAPAPSSEAALASLRLPFALQPEAAFQDEALRGRSVLVHFLSTWCFPCLSAVTQLKSLQSEYGRRGLQVLAVGMDLEGAVVLAPFAQHYELNFPLLVADEAVRRGETPFGRVSSLPRTFLLGRDGRLKAAFDGVLPFHQLRQLVEKDVGENPPELP